MSTRKNHSGSEVTRDINDMLPFVQFPKNNAQPVKVSVKELVVKPKMTNDQIKAREGT